MTRRVQLVLVAGLSVIVLGGCGAGSSESSVQSKLEQSIRSGLPAQIQKASGEPAKTQSVNCVQVRDRRFECIAKVQPKAARGNAETVSVPILGSCDDQRCIWHTQDGRTTNTADSTSDLSEDWVQWAQITCAEVQQAVQARDLESLARAGAAVAHEALAALPNANEKQLIAAASRDVVLACRKASNPSFQPFTAAQTALLMGRRP
jgi:hypothetical protein